MILNEVRIGGGPPINGSLRKVPLYEIPVLLPRPFFFGLNEFNYGVKSAQPFSQIITGKRQAFSTRVGHIRIKSIL